MAQLIVRNLEASLVKALKARAAKHGRSAEAEHREILRAALQQVEPTPTLKDLLLSMPNVGLGRYLKRRRDYGRPVRL
jgi:plasmid stability protein